MIKKLAGASHTHILEVEEGRWSGATDPFQARRCGRMDRKQCEGPQVFALRVKGDSIVPEFNEGDIVIVSPHVRTVSGDYVVVKNDEAEVTLKQLKKCGTKRILHSLNPKYDDIELSDKKQFRIVGKIVEKKKRYR